MSDEQTCERCQHFEKDNERLRTEMGALLEAIVSINPSISNALHKLSVLGYQVGEVLKK